VYDYDIPECYSTVCHKFELEGGEEVPCDAVPSFVGTLIGAPATWQFNNTSTASSPMLFSWNITDLTGGPGTSYSNQQDITHTFINAHTYQICLTVTQLNTPIGMECTFTYCDTITIDEVSDHLNFNLGYTCKDEPELYINFMSTSAPQVDISTTCVGGSTPQNNGIYAIPLVTPLVVATQPPYNWSSCWVTVTTIGLSPNISATQYMYFNCQPCPGTPGFDSGTPNVFQPEPAGTNMPGITVFPNPSSPGELQVMLNELTGPSSLQVVDIEGKVLQTFTIDIEYSRMRMPLNTSELAAGMYFLRLQTADEVTVKKFVIK
ncbi:MAG: T9SS type A sorting domain-containing protein, partial [Phaeodactylibacter sp.]|nr:T9SS type A sorting domain-containing protein [Phaeodactylibacter sp.]